MQSESATRAEELMVLAGPQTHAAVLRLAQAEIPRGAKVLDCPAGSGALTRDLLKAGYDVVPADLFPGNFKLPGRQCIFLDMHEKFPLADESLDAIICVEGI